MVFRGWECSHSIRSEILLRYWCPDFFFNSSKKSFFRSIKKKVWKFSKKWKFSKFSKLSKNRKFPKKKSRDFLCTISTFLKISEKNQKKKSKNRKFSLFRKCSNLFFLSTEKIFFEEVEKNPDINIEAKFHCESNGSTPSLWKPL